MSKRFYWVDSPKLTRSSCADCAKSQWKRPFKLNRSFLAKTSDFIVRQLRSWLLSELNFWLHKSDFLSMMLAAKKNNNNKMMKTWLHFVKCHKYLRPFDVFSSTNLVMSNLCDIWNQKEAFEFYKGVNLDHKQTIVSFVSQISPMTVNIVQRVLYS